jgi:hypothetical protein
MYNIGDKLVRKNNKNLKREIIDKRTIIHNTYKLINCSGQKTRWLSESHITRNYVLDTSTQQRINKNSTYGLPKGPKFKEGDTITDDLKIPYTIQEVTDKHYWIAGFGFTHQEIEDRYKLVEEKPIVQPVVNNCRHLQRKKVQMVYSSYWYCPECKADLGDA